MALTGRKLAHARNNQAEKLISVWCTPGLKRDVKRIATHEKKSQSMVCAGLIRLGIERYFDEADDEKLAPLRAAMKDLFFLGEPDPAIQPTNKKLKPFPVKPKYRPRTNQGFRLAQAKASADEFDRAIDEGLEHFASLSR
jgi:hypothetical protein